MKFMNTPRKFTKKQGGFTITELMLVLGVGAIVIGGAYIGYKSVSEDASNQQLTTASVQLLTAAKSKWQSFGSYAGLSNAAVVAATIVPKTFIVDTGTGAIQHSYGGGVTFALLDTAGAATTSNYRAQFTGIPKKLCSDLVSAVDGVAFDIRVGGTAAGDAVKTATTQLDGAATLTKCSAADTTDIYIFVR